MGNDEYHGSEDAYRISRRELIANIALTGALVFLGAGVVNAFGRFVYPPAKGVGGAGEAIEVGPEADLTLGKGIKHFADGVTYWVIHVEQGFKAFNAKCTHAGCIVDWVEDAQYFHCPCHAAVFDRNGQVVSGPAPLPLKEATVFVKNSKIFLKG